MRQLRVLPSLAVLAIATVSASAAAQFDPNTIITLERAALDRWGKGDPQGYLETYAPEITYFDPSTERRIDGQPTMQAGGRKPVMSRSTSISDVDAGALAWPSYREFAKARAVTACRGYS